MEIAEISELSAPARLAGLKDGRDEPQLLQPFVVLVMITATAARAAGAGRAGHAHANARPWAWRDAQWKKRCCGMMARSIASLRRRQRRAPGV
ncbi:MAG: hypothetical protein Q4A97_12565, partial [Comamonadaceae bacterium]|nr:hypothetical protein [Comamonadaceae bacterium]